MYSYKYHNPAGLKVHDRLYVADNSNSTIRKITPAGVVSTIAGSPNSVGSADGPGSTARFNSPEGLATDSAGNVYVADSNNNTVRKITPVGVVSTVAGLAVGSGSANGSGSAARFGGPASVAVDSAGNVYVADQYNHTIRIGTPATFAEWQKSFFSQQQLSDPAISGDLADFDKDGLPNLLEYAGNGSPNTPSTSNRPSLAIDANYFSLVYTRVIGLTDLTYTIEHSTDLVNWSVASPTEVVLATIGVRQTIKAQIPILMGPPNQGFLRLRVSH